MQNGWIIDVLTDLRTFAQLNGLSVLAEQLDDTRLVAAAELAAKSGNVPVRAEIYEAAVGGLHRSCATSENA